MQASEAVVPVDSVALLVGRVAQGDRSAEAELCRRFSGAAYAFARRRLRSREAVDEFVQDVFVEFLQALRRGALQEPDRVGGFLLGICRNLSFDRVRQRERRDALWAQYGHVFAEQQPESSDEPTPDVIKLEDCLAQLSSRARDVMRFSYVEALSHQEVAAKLEISEANARVLRHRTLHALRGCMSKPLAWEGA